MADVSGIGGAEYSVANSGFSTEESGRLKRPPREEARTESTTTTPARDEAAQAQQRSAQSSQQQNDGDAQRNSASTGDFTAGGTGRQADTVSISDEARNTVQTDRSGDTASTARPDAFAEAGVTAAQGGGLTTTETPASRPGPQTAARTTTFAGANETTRNGPVPASSTASPAAAAFEAREVADVDSPDRSNQSVRNENSNAEVSGGEAGQSEQSRTIGQVVDVFA